MSYTISEVAEHYKISPHTLRFYDKEGLLNFVARNESGVRLFEDVDFEWLNIILCLRSTGMPIKQIKQFVDLALEGDSTIAQRLDFIQTHTKNVEEQLEELMQHMVTLRYKTWYYKTALDAGTVSIHGSDSRAIFDQLTHSDPH